MTQETRLQELLSLWEQRLQQGENPTAADLCRECPDLAVELERWMRAVRTGDRVADAAQAPTAPQPSETTPGEASPAPRQAPDVPGYEVLGELGRGGMGIVYKARHLKLDRLVALKFLNPHAFQRPDAVARFEREARAASALAHPNIVTVYDAGVAGEHPFLALEYVEGVSLARLVEQVGPLPVDMACELVRQAAEGLQHASERGMAHRDIKPENLMRTRGGRIKILDFGLACWLSDAALPGRLTAAGVVMGTPDYMAPEQIRDPHRADTRADIYSLGCTLYHLLAGHAPFHRSAPLEKLADHLAKQPEPLSGLRPEVRRALAPLLERMLAKNPDHRYATPGEVARALTALLGKLPGPGAPARRPRPWRLGAAVLAAVGGLLLVWLFTAGRGDRDAPQGPPPAATTPAESGTGEIRQFPGNGAIVWGVAYSPSGQHALSCSGNPADGYGAGLCLWDVATGKPIRRFKLPKEAALCVAFSPDGKQALAGTWTGAVRLWDVDTASELRAFHHHTGRVHGVAFSPDGRSALSGSYDGTLLYWDVQTGEVLRRLEGHQGAVTHVALSRDGRLALSGGGDMTVRLWEVETGKEKAQFKTRTRYVTCVAISPDGRYALSAGDTVQLWDLEKGKEVREFKGHEDCVWRVVFSADGSRALSCGKKTVRLWDVRTGRELRCFRGHTDQVYCVAFSPDNREAISASQDGTVRLWRLPSPASP